MASNGLGVLTLDLVARIGAFTGPLSAAERELKKKTDRMNRMAYDLGEGIGRSLRSAAGHFLAFAGVSVSIGAVGAAIKGAIDSADKLNDMSIRLGASAEALSGWSYAAKQTGTDIDALGVGFKKLQASMADALDPKSEKGKLFSALGVSVTDTTGKLKTLEQIVPEIATAFQGLNDDALQTKVAMDLFGKSGTDLIEFLELGGQGLTEMQSRARELGLVLSDDTLKAADAFNDGLTDLKSIAQGMAQQLAAEMLPALQDFIDGTLKWWKEGDNAKNVMDALKGTVDLFKNVLSGAGEILSSFNVLLGGTSNWAGGAAEDIKRLANDVKSFTEIAASAVDFLGASIRSSEADANAARERLRRGLNGPESPNIFSPLGKNPNWSFAKANGGTSGWSFAGANGAVDSSVTSESVRNHYTWTPSGSSSRRSGGARRGSGVSQEARDAERLNDAYKRLMESMAERTYMLGKEGEVARITWDIQHGELAKLSQAQKDAALVAAQAYDLAVAKEQVRKEGEAEAKRKAEQAQREAEARTEFIGSMQEEIKLLGMSNAQQEIYNNLKHLGADATDAEKESVIALTQEIQKMRDMRDLAEGAGNAFGDLFYDIASGSKSAKDAFKDFMASLTDMILQFIARKLAEKMTASLMGLMGDNGNSNSYANGQGGSIWGELLGLFGGGSGGGFGGGPSYYGGGLAVGGTAKANTLYRVNENGTELLSVGGKDYLMMGNQSGYVTPSHRLSSGGGVNQVINNNYAAPTDPRTQQQMAKQVGYETRRAVARNA